MPSQGKTALIAAITLTAVRIYALVGPLRMLIATPGVPVLTLVGTIGAIVFSFSVPAVLLVFYRSGLELAPSKKLRHLAVAASVVLGIGFAAPILYDLIARLIEEMSRLNEFPGTTVAAKLVGWLGTPEAYRDLRECLIAFSYVTVVAVLISLHRGSTGAPAASGQAPLVTDVAMVATILAGLYFAFAIIGIGRVAMADAAALAQNYGTAKLNLILSRLEHFIPELCAAAVPLIVYRSQMTLPPGDPVASEQLPEQTSPSATE